MSRSEFPRVHELIDLIEDRESPAAYFQDFDNSLHDSPEKKRVWLAREAEFDKLDQAAWDALKSEACPHLANWDVKRGWQQLITILNQARAYNFLRNIGCSTVRFVPRATQEGNKTPDLEARSCGLRVLCEVKTINVSDKEASARHNGQVRTTSDRLDTRFLNKVRSTLERAKAQIEAFENGEESKRIAFMVIDFDDSLGQYKKEYYAQIDDFLACDPVVGVEIVFYNQRTPFHTQISMKFATVVNEE